MKTKLIGIAFAVAALAGTSTAATAKGCIKGAAVGGVAGHVAGHHGILGATAGCLIGRHQANKSEKAARVRDAQRNSSQTSSGSTGNTMSASGK